MSESDDELLARAVAGDMDALSEMLRRHGEAVAARLNLNRKWQGVLEVADVMQVTYMEAFLHIARFDSRQASFRTWLTQIAQNNLRDAVRAMERQKQPQPERRVAVPAGMDSYVGLLETLATTSQTPSRVAGTEEAKRFLAAALEQLPPDYAAAVRLYDLEGLAIAEVASRMGRSTGAVHMLRARAHDRLRQMLGSASQYFSTPA